MKNQIYCLLIDDDTDDRDFFNVALRNVNPDILVHYSPSGHEAIDNLRSGEYNPDYIFLDLNMMPMNGIECLREIKKLEHYKETPVIIYSTTITDDIKDVTLRAGAFDHLEKPSKRSVLEDYLLKIFDFHVGLKFA
ncbi:hypothetical protein CNR22_01380 [Sphingobacteriaceae bacterium]|nr:hypothetical protein CNR22_01380 [Sphingobacteriaceae bacterium]